MELTFDHAHSPCRRDAGHVAGRCSYRGDMPHCLHHRSAVMHVDVTHGHAAGARSTPQICAHAARMVRCTAFV